MLRKEGKRGEQKKLENIFLWYIPAILFYNDLYYCSFKKKKNHVWSEPENAEQD